MSGRRIGAGLSTHPEAAVAVAEAIGSVTDAVGVEPDLAVVFAAGRFAGQMADALEAVETLLHPTHCVAVTASGLLAGSEEVEGGDAVAIWAGNIGPVIPLRLDAVPGGPPTIVGLPDDIDSGSTVVVLADPYSFPADALIGQMAEHHPGVDLAGGLASLGPEANRLWIDRQEFRDGAIAFVLPPGVARPVVSQGCRPIGQPWIVTAGEGQLIQELGGAPAMQRLNEMVASLDARDRLCASQGLHLGMVADERAVDFERGDFLIRGVLGADKDTGAIAVGAEVVVGQTVQFQVRDAESAHEDLTELLPDSRSSGALVFTCNGRGSHLFAEPHHDAVAVSEATAGGVAGMFCAGELGPIGPVNAMHGFTATVVLFP